MPPSRRLATRLRQIRKERQITQEALAKRARISRVYLAQLERQRQDPSLSIVVRLAKALKVKIGDLVD
jgi:transcriptional regulator with XRE-family HTH domain